MACNTLIPQHATGSCLFSIAGLIWRETRYRIFSQRCWRHPEARSVFGVTGELPGIDLEAWAPGMAKKAFVAVYTDLAAGGSRCLARWGMRQQGGTVVYLRRSAGAPIAQSPLAG
ncbi:MAG: hypothetical protein K9G59_18015 [Caulobacter sp.]|nr:hypothetical protein [Caulobacter sp.]